MTTPGRRRSEGGYALLLVYAMAASVAVMLYMEIPRVAFEAQRDKEQLLIDRGEQYTRAIQLYVRKYNRFPADMQALENTQNVRFLRRQYVDPMTGKNEWRVVHVGPGGIFTDSLIHKPKKETSAPQNFITEMQQIGGGGAGATPDGVNLAARRRPSDGPAGQADPFAPQTAEQRSAGGGQSTGAQPVINGPVMVLPDGRIVPATANGQPPPPAPIAAGNTPQIAGQATPSQLPAGVGVQQGNNFPGQPSNGLPAGFQTTPNGSPGAPPQAAANLINQILTTPRPGGLNGVDQGQNGQPGQANPGAGGNSFGNPLQGVAGANQAGGQTIGGGIAGVASKLEREGIKLYNEKSAYHEWEFVYDMSKDPLRGGGRGGGAVPQPSAQPNGQPIPGPTGSGTATPTPRK
ncbi:MAG: hypothetical protein JWN34_4025 [Bryobacterales bacterium]|nr:hypothetical protein [Bryobacterales bacterium]